MVDTHWDELREKELRYLDHSWRLTGDVAVRDRGELLAVEAVQTDDVRSPTATLYFGLAEPPDSLNPGSLAEGFDRLERSGDTQYLIVKRPGRTYRYELHRIEYE